MDSLLASYASSDEEDEQQQQQRQVQAQDSNSSFSKSLEPSSRFHETLKTSSSSSSSSSSSLFNLPPPKSVFSSLPPPKSNHNPNPQTLNPNHLSSSSSSSSNPKPNNPKRVIQFKPPLNPSLLKTLDDDDDDDDEKKPRKITNVTSSSTGEGEASSVKSFFSSLPAPKNSLGLGLGLGSGSAALGAGRKSMILETNNAAASDEVRVEKKKKSEELRKEEDHNLGNYEGNLASGSLVSDGVASDWAPPTTNESYENYGSCAGGYENSSYATYEGSYGNYDGSVEMASTAAAAMPPTSMAPEVSVGVENFVRLQGKRGRTEIPTQIIEVTQDDLMKNRPREDQVKSTGIAFGPSYQPASTKEKPSKLHKRKHQIGSLYFDMRSKEMELAERRSKGFLTKAETQAKYGW